MFDSINRQKERVSDFVRRLKTIALQHGGNNDEMIQMPSL
jgi:hypothetical protein